MEKYLVEPNIKVKVTIDSILGSTTITGITTNPSNKYNKEDIAIIGEDGFTRHIPKRGILVGEYKLEEI